MDIAGALLLTLGALALVYLVRWGTELHRSRSLEHGASQRAAAPGLVHIAIGFGTTFFDTLGIGSFATTTTIYPGTMLVGHALPVVVQAFAFISIVSVDRTLLVSLIVAMEAGGWLGAGLVSRLPRRVIQLGMATGLLLAGFFMTVGLLGLYPSGGEALALAPIPLVVAAVANFAFGALATLGIGNYGPSLVLFGLLGMDPRAAFPVMMGSGAFMGVIASTRLIRSGCYAAPAAIGLTVGGIPGVLIAVWLVKVAAARRRPVGRHCRRALHSPDAHSIGVRRSPRAGGSAGEQSRLAHVLTTLSRVVRRSCFPRLRCSRVQPPVYVHLTDEWIAARMLEGLNGQIDIKVRPIEMMLRRELDIRELPDGRVAEPRKILERQEMFVIPNQEPEPVSRDVSDFNC